MKKLYLVLIVSILSVSFLFAQSDSVKTTLSEVLVTATRTATPAIQVGSSYSIITSAQIEQQQINTVVDVLRELPGLTILQQGGLGKIANVFIRGANPNHTLVIMDGVVLNDPSSPNNAFDFSSLNTNDIDRIEVVRGPQSTLYGSDAMAGVINIITKKGTEHPYYSFLGETGSNSYYRGNLSALGSYGIMNYAVTASRSGSNGISASDARYGNTEKDAYSNDSFMSRLGFDLLPNLSLNVLYKYTKANTSLDQSEKFGDDPNFTSNFEEQLFKGGIHYSLFNGIWQQSLNASLIKNYSRSLDLPDNIRPNTSLDAFGKAQRIKYDWQNILRVIDNNLVTFGVETSTEEARTSSNSTSDWGPYNSVFPDTSIRTTAYYLQDQINFGNTFFTTVGVRHDQNQKFGGATTYRIAPAYFINSVSTKIKMSYGTGFKAPSLFYLFDPMYGNPNLKPEESKGWDIGFEKYFFNNSISLGITYFNMKFENMFGYDSSYREINIAQASSKGIEFTTSLKNFQRFSLDASYTYTKTLNEYNDGSDDYNKSLLRRPQDQFSINANYQLNSCIDLNMQIQYVGKRDDKDFTDFMNIKRVTLADYTLFNLSASYKVFDYLKLNARLENVFDKQYEEVLYYGTLGRALYVGIELTY